MNRAFIAKFAEQCRTTHGRGFGNGSSGDYEETFDEEKFAELIIQECAELVIGYYDERTMQWAGPRIKQHFGIE